MEDLRAVLEGSFAELASRHGQPLASVALTRHKSAVWLFRASAYSAFEIGSVTKTFTALLLAKMALDGRVTLEDRLDKYLPRRRCDQPL